jgi:hypothetical protein
MMTRSCFTRSAPKYNHSPVSVILV